MSLELDDLRAKLDQLDDRIVEVLGERQRVINEVSAQKLPRNSSLFDPQREQEILARLGQKAAVLDLNGYFVTRVFREILRHSVRRQEEHARDTGDPKRQEVDLLTVGFQGIEGAYSHIAATQHFAARNVQLQCNGFPSFPEMMHAVRDGKIDYALLPIENTTAGSINEAYDLLARMDLALVGEEVVEINHCLMALEQLPVSRIRRIYSHPQALLQCSEFLGSLVACEVHSFTDTAMAARRLRDDQDLSEAAIASEEAARLYGLHILKRGIANQKEVYTRFVVVAREAARFEVRIPCKTSIIFATRHREGALAACLNVLADHHLNLSKLESRPRPNTHWEYLFYADFHGNLEEDSVKKALHELAPHTNFLKILGSYAARVSKTSPVDP